MDIQCQQFGHIVNKYILYSGKDCMKKFCASFREHAKNLIGLKKKEMLKSNQS